MKCCVPNCTINTLYPTSDERITFHTFPKAPARRETWLGSLSMSLCDIKDNSVVCSNHFTDDDLCESKGGTRKVNSQAVPRMFAVSKGGTRKVNSQAVPRMFANSDQFFQSPAAQQTCRICLTIHGKFYNIHGNNLDNIYEILTGTCLTDDDKLPQKLCWECAHRLLKTHRLRDKALKAQDLLLDILRTENYVAMKDVIHIDEMTLIRNGLQTTLTKRILDINRYDRYFKHNTTEQDERLDGNEQLNELKEENSACYNEADAFETSPSPSAMPLEVEIKDECSEIFAEEFPDNFESDDDIKLSDVVGEKLKLKPPEEEKVKRKEKLKRKKVKSEVKPPKVKRLKMRQKRAEGKVKNEDDEDPVTATQKYKNSNVKRRRRQDALDESLFNISTLTYEEQIAEVDKRQETNAYKNAPFKCTICYRGFIIMDRYIAHNVRHSDASGAFECFICKTRLKTSRALRKHLTAQHTEQFSCKGCPFVTRNRGVAREHEKWHSGTKYQCPHCASEFDKITTYMGHIRIKHASDFVCEMCGFTFVSRKGVDVHKKKKHRLDDEKATLEGPYCEICDVRFLNEDAHDRHMKLSSRHSNENDPDRIRNDSQSMNSNGRLTRKVERRPSIHPKGESERAIPQTGPITCEQCGIQLRNLRLYAWHFRRAHPDKNRTKYPAMKTPCMCEQCGRIFQSMALLKDHMWVHTGEKRFKCDRCDKSFTQKTNLMFHIRSHTNARPSYECPLCGKQFAFHNNRRRHMFIHTGLKPFKCETCGKCFTTSGEQRAHVEHVHMKKPWPKRARTQRSMGQDAMWQDKTLGQMED